MGSSVLLNHESEWMVFVVKPSSIRTPLMYHMGHNTEWQIILLPPYFLSSILGIPDVRKDGPIFLSLELWRPALPLSLSLPVFLPRPLLPLFCIDASWTYTETYTNAYHRRQAFVTIFYGARISNNAEWRWRCITTKNHAHNQNKPNECNQLISYHPNHHHLTRHRSPIVYTIVGTPYYAPSPTSLRRYPPLLNINLSDHRIANNKY